MTHCWIETVSKETRGLGGSTTSTSGHISCMLVVGFVTVRFDVDPACILNVMVDGDVT